MAWKRVRGHDANRARFEAALRRGRLGHAYLFVGPPGVGKRLFADELAKALLCEDPPGPLAACDREKIDLELNGQDADIRLHQSEGGVAAGAVHRRDHYSGVQEPVLLSQPVRERHDDFYEPRLDTVELRGEGRHQALLREARSDALLELGIARLQLGTHRREYAGLTSGA